MTIDVRAATRADVDQVAVALGRAFADDPVWCYLAGINPAESQATKLARMLALVHLRGGPVHEQVFVATDGRTVVGAAMWAGPGHWRTPIRRWIPHVGAALGVIGVRGLPRLGALQRMEAAHPKEPEHHYLAVLGTDPAHQGRGVGAALMAPVLEQCDADGVAAYLESSKESNLSFYARHGFRVTSPLTLRDGPMLYPMLREPRPPQ